MKWNNPYCHKTLNFVSEKKNSSQCCNFQNYFLSLCRGSVMIHDIEESD